MCARIGKSVVYADAREADISGIQAVAEQAWRATYRDIFPDDVIADFLRRGYATDVLAELIRRPDSLFLVAREADRVVAYCSFASGTSGPQLLSLYVIPGHWRGGFGRRLLELLEARLRERAVGEYFCFVHPRNEIGKAFYLKHGFVRDSARDFPDHWCLTKPLLPMSVP